MHIHGGWFNWGSAQAFRHLAGHIAAGVGIAAFVPDYRLAPEHPFPAAAEDVRACYFGLVEQGFSKIAITGDSAGGTLAIGLLVSLAANRAFAAEALVGGVALSPVTDLTLSGESWSTRALADPYFTRPQAAELVRSYLDGEPDLPNERGSSFGWSLPRRQVHRSDSAGAAPADQVEMVTVSRVSRFGSLEAGHLFSNHTSLSWHRWHRGLPADKRLLACVDIVRCH
jgi:acetyl esterase/lipase